MSSTVTKSYLIYIVLNYNGEYYELLPIQVGHVASLVESYIHYTVFLTIYNRNTIEKANP